MKVKGTEIEAYFQKTGILIHEVQYIRINGDGFEKKERKNE